jgi:prepilin-type N-terminal cleavage/methylation domain-containing protein
MKNKGFTILEVMLVVILISILAAIVIPRFVVSTKHAKVQSCEMNRAIINKAVESFYFVEATWPDLDLNILKQSSLNADMTASGDYDPDWYDARGGYALDPAAYTVNDLYRLSAKYFPDGIPTCPLDESSYVLFPSPIFRVSGHREGAGTHIY